jgi:murein DD-endopeptidase MepM/ murein hydrolase activator NlpD
MKHSLVVTALIAAVLAPLYLHSELRDPDDVINKDRDRRDQIIDKDRERQERILRKFNEFVERVKKRTPGFDMSLPVSIEKAQDIIDQKSESKKKTAATYTAFAGENYRLRAQPSDASSQYTARLTRGTRLTVLFTESVKADRRNITLEWAMVRTGAGVEGYMPLNLLIKQPAPPEHAFLWDRPVLADYPVVGAAGMFPPGGSAMTSPAAGTEDFRLMSVDDTVTDDSAARKYTVDVDTSLYIRATPSQEGQVLGELRKGDIVEVLRYSDEAETIYGKTARWAFVRAAGAEGWVFSAFLKRPDLDARDDPAALKPGASLYVKSALLRLRDEPGDAGTVITSIPHQKSVRIVEVTDELQSIGRIQSKWVKIEYEEFSGWVFGGFLSKSRNAYLEDDDIDFQFIFPVDGYRRISSPFGYRPSPTGGNKDRQEYHSGIDIPAPAGTPVGATADGFVILAQENNNGYGLYVMLEHKNGTRSLYGHLSQIKTTVGSKVKAGEIIGLVGSTGRSTGPHLHFEIVMNGQAVNPEQYMHAGARHGAIGDVVAILTRRFVLI